MTSRPHIAVCVCTYKRPERLRQLLSRLDEQRSEGLFDYSVVIVDNDRLESARPAATAFAGQSSISMAYHVEPEQNIALARNGAIAHARGDFVALIDDDELPPPTWLLHLYRTIIRYGSDGVLGPVFPAFERQPPAWVVRGRFFERATHPTGYVLSWNNTRTGNALLRRNLFQCESRTWFDPALGSGGEDRDFFRRQISHGRVFVWCAEAPVVETVPPQRWRRTVMLKRAFLRGKMALKSADSKVLSVLTSVFAVALYALCLPLLLVLGHHLFMRYLISTCDHLGKLLAFFAIDIVRQQYVEG